MTDDFRRRGGYMSGDQEMVLPVMPDGPAPGAEWDWADEIGRLRAQVAALTADNEKLRHRLFPSQGEGYASEVERQRNVIDGMRHAAEVYRDKAAAAESRLAAVHEIADVMDESGHRLYAAKLRAAIGGHEQ